MHMLVLGALSKDINITPEETEYSTGGAVVYAAGALQHIGADFQALTKIHPDDQDRLEIFERYAIPFQWRPSSTTTSIQNTYHTADRERRTCEALAQADPFTIDDLPEGLEAEVYYMGGLMKGEFPTAFVCAMADRGRVAVDVQGFLRVNENGPMVFRDWPEKQELIPRISYLKTDAAEAEILTGLTDRREAARTLASWGAEEIVLTHNSEVLVYAGDKAYTAPFTPKNLSGRTGRGDTCFSAYIAWRRAHGIEEACRFAAALTSLKMETPGPFTGSVETVIARMQQS